jgi:hypothetical protein
MGSAESNIPTTKPKSVGSRKIEAGTAGNQQVVARVAGRRVYRVSRSRISLGGQGPARAAASSIADRAPSWRSHSAITVGSSPGRSPEGVERAEFGKRPGNAGRVELEDLMDTHAHPQIGAGHRWEDGGHPVGVILSGEQLNEGD